MFRLAIHWQIIIGMAAGAIVGIGLNASLGEREQSSVLYTADEVEELVKHKPQAVVEVKTFDSPDLIRIDLKLADGTQRQRVIDPTQKIEGALPTLRELGIKDKVALRMFKSHGRSWARWTGDMAKNVGDLFLRLLSMVSIPLIVTSLMTGVMGLGNAKRLGKMFGRTILYYLCTSLLAIVTGLLFVNMIKPGLNSDLNLPTAPETSATEPDPLGEVMYSQVERMIPRNPFGALAEGNFLSIISFSLAFAIFSVLVGGKPLETMRNFFKAGFDIIMAMTLAIIKLAPIGVTCLMLYVTASQGAGVFVSLFWYMLTVMCGLLTHSIIVLPLILTFVARRNPLQFAKAMSPALMTAFSSSSSNATLPLTLTSVEQRAGVSNRVSSFVLPLGATINMDGTALYEAVAVLFIAQLYHGDLSFAQQVTVAVTALLASIGAAGIPQAGLVMMIIILQAVNLPLYMQGIIIGVDRVLDMFRTAVNVWSDSCGCAVVARFESSGAADVSSKSQPSEPT